MLLHVQRCFTYYNSPFLLFSYCLARLWRVSITTGCTAAGLTRCRLRTFVMTNYISYTELDFINTFFHYEVFCTFLKLRFYYYTFPKRRKAAYNCFLVQALKLNFIIFYSSLTRIKNYSSFLKTASSRKP